MKTMPIDWQGEVKKRKAPLLDDLVELLRIQSVKDLSTSTEEKPMGKEIGEVLEHMLARSVSEGFAVKNIQGYAGYAELGMADEYTGVLCHLDVVPAPGVWKTPPFDPAIRDGKLYARGAIDDKGPTMAVFYAMKILKALNVPLKRKIRLIFGTDEESGMRCMKKYQEVEGMPEMGFAPDAVFPIVHAEKGQINARLCIIEERKETDPNAAFQLLEFVSGERGNMVPDHAAAKVKGSGSLAIKEKFARYCEEQGLEGSVGIEEDAVLLELKGKAAHGMEPFNGVNAGLELAHFLSGFSFSGGAEVFLHFAGGVLYRDFHGENLGIAITDEVTGALTVNVGILRFGEDVSLQLNIRCPVKANYLRTIEILMEKGREHGLEVDEIREKKPHHVSADHPMVHVMQEAYRQETGGEPELLSTGGATYARFIENGVAFGAVFPGKEMTAHQVNEYIEIDDLLKATAIYARTLYELANL